MEQSIKVAMFSLFHVLVFTRFNWEKILSTAVLEWSNYTVSSRFPRFPFAPGRFAQGRFAKLGNYIFKSYLSRLCYAMLCYVRLDDPGRTGIGAKRLRCERNSGRNDPKSNNVEPCRGKQILHSKIELIFC